MIYSENKSVLTYQLVQVVPQEVRALVAAMSVVNSEKGALGPLLIILFQLWLHYIQNDGHAVLIVVSKAYCGSSTYLEMPWFVFAPYAATKPLRLAENLACVKSGIKLRMAWSPRSCPISCFK